MQHVVATGESIGAVNLLFRVNDRFESYFNRTTGCSASFAKQLQEGRRQVVSTLRFLAGKQVLDEKNLVSGNQQAPGSAHPALRDRPDVGHVLWRLATACSRERASTCRWPTPCGWSM